jgi:hypothetical protein
MCDDLLVLLEIASSNKHEQPDTCSDILLPFLCYVQQIVAPLLLPDIQGTQPSMMVQVQAMSLGEGRLMHDKREKVRTERLV